MIYLPNKFIRISLIAVLGFSFCGFSYPQLKNLEMYIVQEDFDRARKEADQLLKNQDNEELRQEIRYFLALIDLKTSEYKKAQDRFRELSKTAFDVALRDKASLGLIDAYYLNREYDAALIFGERFLKERPKTDYKSLLYFKLARINLKLAKWVDARNYLRRILRQYPRSTEVSLARQFLEEKQYFSVQVGAFLDRSKAQMQVGKLKRKGEYAYIVETTDGRGRKFYRVRVGQLAYLSEAEELKAKLAQEGYPFARIYP